MHLRSRYATRYAGHWVVARGDTLTLPQMGDRFKLSAVTLDTARVAVGRTCRYRGALVFQAPRAETLAVNWLGQPDQALIYRRPAEAGPLPRLRPRPGRGSPPRGAFFHQPPRPRG